MKTQITQNAGILDYMLRIGPINGMIALEEFRCFRLPARISDLKDAGIIIKDRWVTHENQSGEKKRFKEYWVVEA